MKKACNKCGVLKDLEDFHKEKRYKDGHRTICKSCVKEYNKDYNKKTFKKRKAYLSEYYQKNKEKVDKKKKEWEFKNKDKVKKKKSDYNKKNRKIINKKLKKKYNRDPSFKIAQNLRNRLRCALKRNTKSGKTLELLGCSIEQFKKYLESKFKEGMTWDNKSLHGWHIDHIRPCASFDLSDPEQQKQCFHYTNMQPLWAKENYLKSDKWEN